MHPPGIHIRAARLLENQAVKLAFICVRAHITLI
jgi:hypothetical protein